MDEVQGAYSLGRHAGEDDYVLVRVYEVWDDPFSGPFEEFVIGEPVHLKHLRIQSPAGQEAIWWIQEFREHGGEGQAGLSDGRTKPTTSFVSVLELEKLPEMVRLAVEYAY